MRLHNKILPVALVAALLGGSVGALVMRHNNAPSDTQIASSNLLPNSTQANGTTDAALRDNTVMTADTQNLSPTEQNAYRTGFNDGFDTARGGVNNVTRERFVTRAVPTRVTYRAAPARTVRRNSRTAYYDYTPQRRSFWDKHRDKLTLAMGTGGGALLGGLIGGKKGAAIGALAGGGGSALYTYKIRKRNRRY
ncbi:MAG: hypothetical protein QOF61_1671 [Acidobacteriota bacterium]|jgi:hypothetical protein|nr:hypothetical protein [Acidobacteriota bacterium]